MPHFISRGLIESIILKILTSPRIPCTLSLCGSQFVTFFYKIRPVKHFVIVLIFIADNVILKIISFVCSCSNFTSAGNAFFVKFIFSFQRYKKIDLTLLPLSDRFIYQFYIIYWSSYRCSSQFSFLNT